MGFFQRRLLKFVLGVTRHPRLTLAIVLIVLAGSVGVAELRLHISTDENKLFSSNVPFFRHYLEFIARFPENEAVYIVIEPRDPAAQPPLERWTAVADRITDRLNSLSNVVAGAQCRIPLDQLGRQGILFEDPTKLPAELEDAQRFAPLAQLWGEQPNLATALLGSTPMERFLTGAAIHGDDETASFVSLLTDSWIKTVTEPNQPVRVVDLKQIGADPSRLGYFYVVNELDHTQHRILVRVYPKRIFNSLTAVTQTVDAIRNAATDAGKEFGEFHIGVTGRPALDADQMRITDSDSDRAEIVALAAVFVGLVVMLRSLWLAVAAEMALMVAIGWTFGWTTVSVGELNLLSLVFLIALIGIGMDHLVQILSRYRVEAQRYQRPGAVWVRVFKHVGPPINTACLGASAAFLTSVFTDFQGAADLGIVAGGGLILCLASGYIFLPAILTLFPPKLQILDASHRYGQSQPGSARRLVLPAMWLVALAAVSPFISRTHFDAGLIDLQVQRLESVKLIRTLQTWCAVVLSQDLNQLRTVRSAVAGLAPVASTESVLDAQDNSQWIKQHADKLPQIRWSAPATMTAADVRGVAVKARALGNQFDVPATSESRGNAARLLKIFAADLDRLSSDNSSAAVAAAQLSEWQQGFVKELENDLGAFHPPPLDMQAVPIELRSHLMSSDGYYALYIYPRKDLWNGANLAEFTAAVEQAAATVPGAPPVTGIASNVFHTTAAIHRAFYQATSYTFVVIFLLVLLDFRRLGPTLAAISVLALGLPMLVAMMGLTGASWNFANFFGLPILIGAGHEYGVFMVHRFQEARRDPRRVWTRWDVSDRALLLCAFVTSSSFGFFWLLAEHQGLRSLGLVMALGTACIYLATLTVLRPILRWRLDYLAKNPPQATAQAVKLSPE